MKALFQHKVLFALAITVLCSLLVEGEHLKVDCRAGTPSLKSIGAAIARIAAHPSVGQHVITVSGTCHENVSIIFLDNITLQASSAGASIDDASGGTLDTMFVLGSRLFFMSGFTINGSMSCTNDAVCRTNNNTFQNGQLGWGIRYSRSHSDSVSDVIQTSDGHGVSVQNASRVNLADSTVQGNAADGAHVTTAGYLILSAQQTTTTITNNGNNGALVSDHGTLRLEVANITGNGNNGVMLVGNSVLRMEFANPSVNNVTANGNAGVHVGDQSFSFFPDDGSAIVTGNLGGIDVLCSGQFPATRGALTNIGGGLTNCTEPAPWSKKEKIRALHATVSGRNSSRHTSDSIGLLTHSLVRHFNLRLAL